MIWVLDASVAVRWFIRQESVPNSEAILRRVIDQPMSFAVPELFCFETFSVLCRVHPHAQTVFTQGLMPLINGGILRHPMTDSLSQNACRFVDMGLTGYDACYAALACELNGVWLTFDKKAHRCIANEKVSHDLKAGMPSGWDWEVSR